MGLIEQSRYKGFTFEALFKSVMEPIVEKNNWLLIDNLLLPSRVSFSQIDFVIITPYKYFCIETKNWECTVFCSDDPYWELHYPNRQFMSLSPVQQNRSHVRSLCRVVSPYRVEGLICFSDVTDLIDKPSCVYNIQELISKFELLCKEEHMIDKNEMMADYLKIMKVGLECLKLDLKR